MRPMPKRMHALKIQSLSGIRQKIRSLEKKAVPNRRDGFSQVMVLLKSKNPTERASGLRRVARGFQGIARPFLMTFLRDPSVLVRTQAKVMLAHLDAKQLPELYGLALSDKRFMDPTKSIVRAAQDKPEANTILLGGKLRGKAVIKLMTSFNIRAWKRVMEAGIPVEPILKREGKYRLHPRKDGRIAVAAKVLNGPTVEAFLQNPSYAKRYASVITKQMESIKKRLVSIGVVHGHLTTRNFLVVWNRVKGKRYPKVFLIDFDKAYVVK